MKKYISKIAALVLFTGLLVSCGEQDNVQLDADSAQSLVGFNKLSDNLPAWAPEYDQFVLEIEVGATNRVNYDRDINVVINEELSTALTSAYTIDPSSLVIPAGEFVGKIKVRGYFNEIPPQTKQKIVLDLLSVEGMDRMDTQKKRFVATIFQACPINRDDFVGTYDALEDGTSNYIVESVAGDEPNELLLSNVWDLDPASVTHVYLGDNVASPNIIWPAAYPTSTENFLASDVFGYGPGYVNGTGGTFDSCTAGMVLKFRITVSAGSFAETKLELTKI